MSGPSVEGRIAINTRSVEQAVKSVENLGKILETMAGKSDASSRRIADGISKQQTEYKKLTGTVGAAGSALDKLVQSQRRQEELIAKAANKVANYENAVRKSNLATSQQGALVERAASQLKGYEAAVLAGATSGQRLSTANTQLNVSLGQLNRETSRASSETRMLAAAYAENNKRDQDRQKAVASTTQAVSQANIQFERMRASIDQSALSDQAKATATRNVEQAHRTLVGALQSAGTTTTKTTQASAAYRLQLERVAISTRKVNAEARNQAMGNMQSQMRALTGSVVLALGPLSGIAARLTALSGLFNRNAASLATFLAGMTAFTVLLSRAAKVGQEAEREMLRLGAQLDIMGDKAVVTGGEINQMAHEIAAATLTSASEARQAAGVLLQFGDVGRDQFQSVLETAQGMGAVFGGSLPQNTRKLARALADPITGLTRLEQSMGQIDEAVKDQILELTRLGKTHQATALLLKEFEGLQAAGRKEAEGLSGAYDSVSGATDKLFEQLFNASGAADAATESVNGIAAAINEFADSEEALVLGQAFASTIRAMGGAAEFFIGNADKLLIALAAVASAGVGTLTVSLLKLRGATAASTLALIQKVQWTKRYSVSAIAAAGSARLFGAAMSMSLGPIGVVVTALGGVVAAMLALRNRQQSVIDQSEALANVIKTSGEAALLSNRDITSKQVALYSEQVKSLSEVAASADESIAAQEEANKDLLKSWSDTVNGIDAAADKIAAAQKRIDGGAGRALPKVQRDLVKAQQERLRLLEKQEAMAGRAMPVLTAIFRLQQKKVEAERESLEVNEQIRKAQSNRPAEELAQSIENAQKSLKGLREEFMKSEIAGEALDKQLKEAQDAMKLLKEQGKLSAQELADFNTIIARIKEKQLGSEFESAQTNAKKFMETLKDANNAVKDMEQVNEGANEQLVAQQRMISDLANSMAELDAQTISNLATMLEVEDNLEAVTAAYIARTKAIDDDRIAQEKAGANIDLVNSFFQEQRSEVVQLTDKYEALIAAQTELAEGGDGDERLAAIRASFKKEQELMDERAKAIATQPFMDLANFEDEKARREALLADMFAGDEERFQQHMDTMTQIARDSKPFLQFAHGAEVAADLVGSAMETMQTLGRENARSYQALAIGQAVIAGALAITAAYAEGSKLGPAAAAATAALAAAQTGAQIAAIRAQSFATGGMVRGPGTGTSDSIPAQLSNGEFVMRADAVRKLGVGNLQRMNQGGLPSFSQGGLVGSSSGGGAGGVTVNIIDQSSGAKSFETEESVDVNGARQIKVMVRDAVRESIVRGEFDREMGGTYGVRRQGRRV